MYVGDMFMHINYFLRPVGYRVSMLYRSLIVSDTSFTSNELLFSYVYCYLLFIESYGK